MKRFGVSPDAFIQLALQLAYYRDIGRFDLSYEASMTRLFLHGRTETVRSCTSASTEFVLAMHRSDCSVAHLCQLLRTACNTHQRNYLDAMCGRGSDRHLFALYIVAQYMSVESAFLDAVVGGAKWRLSTSQTPLSPIADVDYVRNPERISAGGGFGPASEDGYGVSYRVVGEVSNSIDYHVCCMREHFCYR